MAPPRASPVHALLEANAKWADAVDHAQPGFFRESVQGQFPKVLWFGCADSRVPESVLTGARPGDIFVHRNIANQFHPNDDSALAVLSYAVGVVGVQHVVIAGHTHCGGALACYAAVSDPTDPVGLALGPTPGPGQTAETPLGRWLTPLRSLVASLDFSNTTHDAAIDVIVEENVKRQFEHICAADPIKQAWAAGKHITVHAWVYDIGTGRIKELGMSPGPDASARL